MDTQFNLHVNNSLIHVDYDFIQFEPFPVQHGGYCHGLKIQHQKGWKIVHSSDTNPCQTVIDAGKSIMYILGILHPIHLR